MGKENKTHQLFEDGHMNREGSSERFVEERTPTPIDTVRYELERIWKEKPVQQIHHRAGWGVRTDMGLIRQGGYWDISFSDILVLRRGKRV